MNEYILGFFGVVGIIISAYFTAKTAMKQSELLAMSTLISGLQEQVKILQALSDRNNREIESLKNDRDNGRKRENLLIARINELILIMRKAGGISLPKWVDSEDWMKEDES
jgi:hypothetical protein